MAAIPVILEQKIKKYIDSLRNDITVNYAILFGSHAYGQPNENSDIDVAVISGNFGNNHINDMRFLSVKRLFSDSSIEPYAISLNDFKNRAKGDFISEIYDKGIIIEKSNV
jgi:uncharacterized protein